MSNKKQTAVEFLFELLPTIVQRDLKHKFEQAKEMEKQQIIDAHIKGDNTYTVGGAYHTAAEQYYNKEYGGNK